MPVSPLVRAALTVSSLERSREFYIGVLGLSEVFLESAVEGGNMHELMGVPAGTTTRICILKTPGTPAYGSLTLFARYHALLESLMTIRSSGFWPKPDVDSMLVRFFLREKPPVEAPEELLFRIIRASFQQRRKQLANTLENALEFPRERVEKLGRHAGIALTRRGETLTPEEFARLARAADDQLRAHGGAD